MTLSCGGIKEKHHYESKGKRYGIIPFVHCDTDCLYMEGTCISRCPYFQINQRACLRAVYGEKERIKITNKIEAEIIIREIDDLVKKGQMLMDKQKSDYEFAKGK